MKRWLAVLLLMLPSVAGFGSDEERPTAKRTTATASEAAPPPAEHGTKHLVCRCGDYRFREPLEKWINEKLGSADEHVWPGCTVCITDPKLQPETFKAIQTYQDLHGVTTIHIVGHRDCGGHGGSKRHASSEVERRYHHHVLREAGHVVQKQFPKLNVKLYFSELDDTSHLHLEEVVAAK